jgi:type IV secretory pathway TraG/TraD family ATPase VirD4
VLAIVIVGAGAAVAYLLWSNRERLKTAFDPTSAQNIAYTGTSKIIQAVTGEKNVTLGSKIADWFKSDAEKAVETMLSTGTVTGYPKIITAPGAPAMIVDYPGAQPRLYQPYAGTLYTGGH